MKTTLNAIRKHEPCKDGWEKLLSYLSKTKADDEPLSIATILDSNGLDDALWCLRAVEGHAKEIRLYTVWCVRQVEHLLKDQRSLDALDVAERYANGEATDAELAAARDAALAAEDAAWDAEDAAWDAWDAWATGEAAGAAARAAARETADAAWGATWVAGEAAWVAGEAAWAAGDAAKAAAEAKQEAELRRICGEG